jgi:hypothetical protein
MNSFSGNSDNAFAMQDAGGRQKKGFMSSPDELPLRTGKRMAAEWGQ